jgi:hypothetical protein
LCRGSLIATKLDPVQDLLPKEREIDFAISPIEGEKHVLSRNEPGAQILPVCGGNPI